MRQDPTIAQEFFQGVGSSDGTPGFVSPRDGTTQNEPGFLPPRTVDQTVLVCLDPGHPSESGRGATASNGLKEYELCFDVAVRARNLLLAEGVTVVLTKNAPEEFASNRKRAEIANEANVRLFLRIHADAGPGAGFTIYYPRRKGTVQGVTGPADHVLRESGQAALIFHAEYSKLMLGHLKDNGIKGDESTLIGSRQGALTGSIHSKVPVLLVEMGFLTNDRDADWLSKSHNVDLVAESIKEGILAWLNTRDSH